MSAVCPGCGVTVVTGYIRCPKCHAGLPEPGGPGGRSKRATGEPGGTTLAPRQFPLTPVLVAVAAGVAIMFVFGLRGGSRRTAAAVVTPAPIDAIAAPQPARQPVPAQAFAPIAEATPPATQDVGAATNELQVALRMQRLWGQVGIAGSRVEVRSGSCADAAMRPLIESKRAVLRGAGLTRLRCVEQSGAVVFEHDL